MTARTLVAICLAFHCFLAQAENNAETFQQRLNQAVAETGNQLDALGFALSQTEAQSKFNEFVSGNKENRATRWSMHYFDTGVKFDEHQTRYLIRTARGSSINKIDKQENFPTSLREDQTFLGTIEKLVTPDGQGPRAIYRFTPADRSIEAVDLVNNKIVEVPELNLSFWRYGDLDDPYVRVHNYERPYADRFSNPEFFEYNPNFRVRALYTAYPEPIPMDVPNSAGEVDEGDDRHGEVEFIMNGKYYKLYVYDYEQIRFTDESEKVYPGGRYLSPDEEDLEKRVFFLDFNFAYDPPCAYSQAYTCSLPTPEEHIDQSVEAGRIFSAWDVY